jgi:hypothetical protein
MGRQPCCEKVGLKKGPWTAEEDQKLVTFLLSHGHCCWRLVPKLAGAVHTHDRHLLNLTQMHAYGGIPGMAWLFNFAAFVLTPQGC